jgi:hypothetical protein
LALPTAGEDRLKVFDQLQSVGAWDFFRTHLDTPFGRRPKNRSIGSGLVKGPGP